MLGKTTNPLLQKAEAATASKVPEKYRNAFERVVAAGLRVMYSEQTHDMMTSQLGEDNPPEINVGEGIAKLMAILFREGKGTIPMEAFIPASVVLLSEGLDFAEKAGYLHADAETLAAATKELMSSLMQVLGITPEKIKAAKAQTGQAGQTTQRPEINATTTQTPQQPAAPKGIIGAAMGA